MGSGVPHRLPSYCRKNRVQIVLGKAITGRLPAAVPTDGGRDTTFLPKPVGVS